jgi:beta-mannosidase
VPPRPGGKEEEGKEQEDEQELRNVPIPTNIHLDLQRAGIITDPHLGTAERDCQWVHERAWRMTTEFYVTLASLAPKRRACLVLEGLDTFATVRVNGTKVLKSSNMFLSHRVDITDRVNLMGKQNVVEIVFESAMETGRRLLRRHCGPRACWNGHSERVFIRKAQYHFGWDWGPSLVTAGPWKPVGVEIYSARLETVEAVVKVKENLKRASLVLRATVEAVRTDAEFAVTVEVVSPAGKRFDIDLKSKDGMYVAEVDIPKPELWYPRNYGEQNIYNATYTLTTPSAPEALHTVTKRFGFRRVELVRDFVPDEPGNEVSGGSTFYFCINNIPIFCGGSNWVPADSFQPRITKDQLMHLLKDLLAERGNQNMIRVWGGGVYESEDFYDICDEAGILVWQDLCFASADYPSNLNWFVESVEAEVRQNMQRLKWHPSLVFVVGNSEDKQVQEEEIGDLPDVPEDDYPKGPFPSRWLYEILFPDILNVVYNVDLGLYPENGTSGVVYWFGSPSSGDDCTDRTIGDIHQWNGNSHSINTWAITQLTSVYSLGRDSSALPTLPRSRWPLRQ